MQNTSETYKRLLRSGKCYAEPTVYIDGFPYGPDVLYSVKTTAALFEDGPQVGTCASKVIDFHVVKPDREIPKNARIELFYRLTDGNERSESIRKGVFYIDSREDEDLMADADGMHIIGYDAMMRAEQDYPSSTLAWPARDLDVVREIADYLGIPVDRRTVEAMTWNRQVPTLPIGYSCREVLGNIASFYAGCFAISESGTLLLIQPFLPQEDTSLLVDQNGDRITVGGDRIIV